MAGESVKGLSLAQIRELAAKKKKQADENSSSNQTIKRQLSKDGQYPLSSFEEGFYYYEKLSANKSSATNPYPVIIEFQDDIQQEFLKPAVNALIQKHDILRTTFHEESGGRLYQYVHNDLPAAVYIKDISALDESEKEQFVSGYVKNQIETTSFDLARGPLVRIDFVIMSAHKLAILPDLHHIISDGWSMSLLVKGFIENYLMLSNGRPPTGKLPGSLEYHDYAQMESQRRAEGGYKEGLDYWIARLDGVEGTLNFPLDIPRSRESDWTCGAVSIPMPSTMAEGISYYCKQQHVTQFHVLLSVWTLLMAQYSGQDDIVIGAPFANRGQPQTQDMIGIFMNVLPLRNSIDKDCSFSTFTRQVYQSVTEATQYEYVPYQIILDNIQVERTASMVPLFQSMMTYQVFPHYSQNQYFKYHPHKVDSGIARNDLNIWIENNAEDEGYTLTLYYRTSLFKKESIQQILDNFCSYTEQLLKQPDQALKDVSILDSENINKTWESSLATPLIIQHTVLDEFKRAVLDSPEAIAIHDSQTAYTYQELDRRSSRLAGYLSGLSLRAGDNIGVFLPKGVESIVSILAIWKLGACYVPIDIKSDEARIHHIINDAKIRSLVFKGTKQETRALPNVDVQVDLDLLDDISEFSTPLFSTLLSSQAYIIYTSGTTGVPKGVVVTHEQLSHYITAVRPKLDLPACASYAMMTSFTTDLAHTVLFSALSNAGSLWIIDDSLLSDPTSLLEEFRRQKVDCMKITPSLMHALLVDETHVDIIPSSVLVIGGESCPSSLASHIQKLRPACRIINHYGPTETTVGVSTHLYSSEHDSDAATLPIGQPLFGSHLVVVDDHLRPLPDGIPGQLCVVGTQTARYQSEQGLSGFNSHPLDASRRLYLTGDRCRKNSQGEFEFLGRNDRQVKIRGFRVDLAEVEVILKTIFTQANVVVFTTQDDQRRNYLTACIAGEYSQQNQQRLQAVADARLVHFMRPSSWIWLEEMPYTASGKIDVNKLKQEASVFSQKETASPDTQTEKQLADLYVQVLNKGEPDVTDDFMALGGDSLIALDIVVKLNALFGTNITVGYFFEKGSIRNLARAIDLREESMGLFGSSSLPILNAAKESAERPWLMVHPAGGNILCYQPMIKGLGTDTPLYGVQVSDFTQVHDYDKSIRTLAAHYLEQFPDIETLSHWVIGGWSLGATIAVEIGRQIGEQVGRYPDLVVLDQPAPAVQGDIGRDLSTTERMAYFAYKIGLFTGHDFNISGEALEAMTEIERSALFLRYFKQAGLVPESVTSEQFTSFLQILMDHIAASDQYELDHYPGNIIVAEAEQLLPGRYHLDQPGLGWQRLTPKALKVVKVDATHISMMKEEVLTSLTAELRDQTRELCNDD